MTEVTTLNSTSESNAETETEDGRTPEAKFNLVEHMLTIQDGLNVKVNPDWRNANYNFMDAIMVEGVELFDHMPWKWWKVSAPISEDTLNKMRVEAVDIWHFIMSIILIYQESMPVEHQGEVFGHVESMLNREMATPLEGFNENTEEELKGVTRALVGYASAPLEHAFYREDIPLWAPLVFLVGNLFHKLGMTLEDVYKLYCGKAVLNEFRWENGYGSTYIKEWFGKEDNDCMVELASNLPVDGYFTWKLKGLLKDKYTQVQMGITG